MAHKLEMCDDGILRLAFIGDQDEKDMEAFQQDFAPFLEAVTEEEPLRIFTDSSQSGKFTSAARKTFLTLNRNPKIGRTAILGASRYTRVLAGLVLKATRRDNIRFFDSETEALAWLKAESP
jgi:hypothetical protein